MSFPNLFHFSSRLSVSDKLKILKDEFGIPDKSGIGKEVELMCNLSLAVREEGWRAGLAEGHAEIIFNMFRKGFTLEQIADIADKTEEEIQDIINRQNSLTSIST